ncbi:Uncharacterized protein FKW44_007357 [Caligus rogercresseyi]|uniref:Uncharacterized protein n=1 Tax=Caligus rogercresseyi TaxID=217165 RepID=A0A7T8KEM1_CALRO|nr:Uncharacterized protein FKW44_007357 [Caligus rogercresseyi]
MKQHPPSEQAVETVRPHHQSVGVKGHGRYRLGSGAAAVWFHLLDIDLVPIFSTRKQQRVWSASYQGCSLLILCSCAFCFSNTMSLLVVVSSWPAMRTATSLFFGLL